MLRMMPGFLVVTRYCCPARNDKRTREHLVSHSLRVLLVSPTLPYRFSGFGTRVWHLVDQLSRSHSVTVLAFVRPDEAGAVPAVAGICSRLETVRRSPSEGLRRRVSQLARLASPLPYACLEQRTEAMQDAFDALVRDGGFDVVIMESSRLGALTVP